MRNKESFTYKASEIHLYLLEAYSKDALPGSRVLFLFQRQLRVKDNHSDGAS